MAYIEILEIDESAGQRQIEEKLRDKYQYFSTLVSTAPTTQLKSIYAKKVSELQSLAKQYSVDLADSRNSAGQPNNAVSSECIDSALTDQEHAILVLHTEGRALRSYTLRPGLNILGRNQSVEHHSIVIEDEYLSRAHAVVEVINVKARHTLVYDIGELPGKKYSTNGVYINSAEQRITGKKLFRPGDTVQVGYAKLVLTYAADAKQQEAMTAIGKKDHSKTVFIKVN